MYNYMIYIITSILAHLFSPEKRLGSILTVNDCDISKFILEWSTLPVFEKRAGTPGGPELARGSKMEKRVTFSKLNEIRSFILVSAFQSYFFLHGKVLLH